MAEEELKDKDTTDTGSTEKGPDTPVVEIEEGIEELKRRLAKAEEDKQAAESRARAAEQRASSASAQADDALNAVDQSHLATINGAIEMLKTAETTLKANYASAMSEGNFTAAADIQAEMATNAAKLLNLENGKIALETKPKREAIQRARGSEDPVERLAAQLTPDSAAWVRRHPEYATGDKYDEMLAAHYTAIAKKHKPDSAEYFAFVEKTLGIGAKPAAAASGNGHDTDETALSTAAAPTTPRDSAPPAAPASRGGNNSRTIRLTPAQKEAAKISGLSEEEYAKQLEPARRN